MFQFTGFASLAGYHVFNMVGCPIRTSADHIVCADPRGFSQLITSFFASESLGIPHTPLSGLSPYLLTLKQVQGRLILIRTSLLKKFVFSLQCTPSPCGKTCALSQYVNELFTLNSFQGLFGGPTEC